MTRKELQKATAVAVAAARTAGGLMRRDLLAAKQVDSSTAHDVKLELDRRCQRVIQEVLADGFPDVALLGEEGEAGSRQALPRWVVDPIDGTVNYLHGIPHAAVSIALQTSGSPRTGTGRRDGLLGGGETVLGVVYDPFADELWTALRGGRARLNGRPIRVSQRPLAESIISLGFGKDPEVLAYLVPAFNALIHRVRKLRIMGSAALALCYVAMGRFDGFAEPGLRLWDIAAGGLIVESAGGEFWQRPLKGGDLRFAVQAHNGRLGRALRPFAGVQLR